MKKIYLQLATFRPQLVEAVLHADWPVNNTDGDFHSISKEQAEQLLSEGVFPEIRTSEAVRSLFQLTAPYPEWDMAIYGTACFLDRAQEIFLYGSLQKLGIITIEAKKKSC